MLWWCMIGTLFRRRIPWECQDLSHQKLICALCFLAYGASADQLDEYVQMAETMVLENVSHFCSVIIACFSDTYLCLPTVADLKYL